jgi:hypothetical protein
MMSDADGCRLSNSSPAARARGRTTRFHLSAPPPSELGLGPADEPASVVAHIRIEQLYCLFMETHTVDFKRLNEIALELDAYWKQIHGLYLDSLVGFSMIFGRIQSEQESICEWLRDPEFATEKFQDQCSFSYEDIMKEEICASGIHEATQGEVKQRNVPGGDNYRILAQLCIVSFSDYWNEYLRKEYALAKGVLDPNPTTTFSFATCVSSCVRGMTHGFALRYLQPIPVLPLSRNLSTEERPL